MLKITHVLFAITTLLGASVAHADTIQTIATASDGKDKVEMAVKIDGDGNLVQLVVDPSNDPDFYSLDQIRKGADIKVAGHRKVLYLSAPNLDSAKGGSIQLKWKHNVIFGGWGSMWLYIQKGGDGKWHIYNGNNIVTKFHVDKGSMGIDNITPVATLAGSPSKLFKDLEPARTQALDRVDGELRTAKLIEESKPETTRLPDERALPEGQVRI